MQIFPKDCIRSFPRPLRYSTACERKSRDTAVVLIEPYQRKFGEHIPLIRRQDVKGFVQRTPVWLVRPLGLDTVRKRRTRAQRLCLLAKFT